MLLNKVQLRVIFQNGGFLSTSTLNLSKNATVVETSKRNFSENAKFFPAAKTPMLPADTFKNKVAFITGGGTGLGKGMAETLSRLGANVFIISRKQDVLEKTAKEIMQKTGNNVAYFATDIRNIDHVKESIQVCEKTFGDLPSIVINNAAGNFISPTERLSPNAIKAVIDIVLYGTLNVTLTMGKRLIEAKKPAAFLSILTTYINTGSAFVVPSACAKSGIAAMTKSLAVEWTKYGMRFNGISPGPIYTKGAFSRLDPTGTFSKDASKRIPIGRLGEVEEIANLASYMVSDYSNWLNGTIIDFDGGEFVFNSGEFNYLTSVTKDQWDLMEKMIKSVKSS